MIMMFQNKKLFLNLYNFSQDEQKFLESEIERLLEMAVIELTEHSSGEFISKIFLRPKKQKGKSRLILHLKSLNDMFNTIFLRWILWRLL